MELAVLLFSATRYLVSIYWVPVKLQILMKFLFYFTLLFKYPLRASNPSSPVRGSFRNISTHGANRVKKSPLSNYGAMGTSVLRTLR